MNDPAILIALLAMGLLGSTHCVGMCGGITTALGMAVRGEQRLALTLLYNLGRIASYALAGLLVALVGSLGREHLALAPVLRGLAGLFMIALGFYIAGWWRGLARLEHLGQYVWKYLRPIGQRFLPVTTPGRALALGAVWGWLPCGLVYSALVLTMTLASPLQGALGMVAFGLGTLPAMVLMGVASGGLLQFFQARGVRAAAGVMLMVFGLWQLLPSGIHGWGHHGAIHGSGHESPGASHGGGHVEDVEHERHRHH